MLPGFRFLFAAIVLSMSILVFGLGAAALLRAAHEEFASKPAWHASPETMFAQQNEATRPVLALLRVDPPAEQKTPDIVPAETAPAVTASTPAEPERIAALEPEDSPPPEAVNPETPVSEISPPVEASPTPETKVAAIENVASPVSEAVPAAPEQASAAVSPEADPASTKIAMLGGPPVTIERPLAAATAEPDKTSVRKRRQAQRAKNRRRMAQRAVLTAQAPQQPDAFGQPTITVRKR